MRAEDLTGRIFGRLTVVGRAGNVARRSRWHCRCSCGTCKVVGGTDLRRGHTKSCGCLQREVSTIHGGVSGYIETKEYTAWKHMLRRCRSADDPEWSNYGGRGIRTASAWDDFRVFLVDVGPAPSRHHSIDRVNNAGHYEPGNVRWATKREQNGNTRRAVNVTIDGRTECLAHACSRYGTRPTTARGRLLRGWTDVDAVCGRAS